MEFPGHAGHKCQPRLAGWFHADLFLERFHSISSWRHIVKMGVNRAVIAAKFYQVAAREDCYEPFFAPVPIPQIRIQFFGHPQVRVRFFRPPVCQ